MTTDTALGVTKIVVEDKGTAQLQYPAPNTLTSLLVSIEKIPYIDHPTITFNKQESVDMPFRMSNTIIHPYILIPGCV